MSNYNEYEEILSQHFSGATLEEFKNILNKAKQYDELTIPKPPLDKVGYIVESCEWHRIQRENKILKEGVKALKTLKYWDFVEYDDYILVSFADVYFDIEKETANKIKAMLEVLKDE